MSAETVSRRNEEKEIKALAGDILGSDRFEKAKHIPHHGSVSVARHSLETARLALRICRRLKKKGIYPDERDVVRSALLHDIGMTRERVFGSVSWIKAYTHPREGALIAEEEFGANEAQRNAIRRHMWPICVVPPAHLTGWIVLAADKECSMREAARRVRTGNR